MEEIKTEEKMISPEAKKHAHFNYERYHIGNKVVGIAVTVIIVIGLLCIGAFWGARHGGRYNYRFGQNYGFGCGGRVDFQENGRQYNRGPRMMRGYVNIQNSETPPVNGQQIDFSAPIGNTVVSPATATPVKALK